LVAWLWKRKTPETTREKVERRAYMVFEINRDASNQRVSF